MRIIYLGSPDFAVGPLQALYDAGHEIAAVVTQPDRPRNRGVMQPTPVKARALELGLPVLTPERIKRPESITAIRNLQPDLLVVVAYGQLLSEELLTIPPLGAINIHGSLLPAYRGAAPIHHAVLNGEKISGASLMYLDRGMDSGDLISSVQIAITPEMTTGDLYDAIGTAGTGLLLTACDMLRRGETLPRTPQDDTQATFAPPLTKEDERLDWQQSSASLHNRIRGLNPWPGAYTTINGKRLKIWCSRIEDKSAQDMVAGTVLAITSDGVTVACGEGALLLTEVQPEGKSRMAAAAWAHGRHLAPGVQLG